MYRSRPVSRILLTYVLEIDIRLSISVSKNADCLVVEESQVSSRQIGREISCEAAMTQKVIVILLILIHRLNGLTLLLLNMTCPVLANSVDPDQLASEEANWSGSALFVIKYVNFYQIPGSSNLAGNEKWAWHLDLFSKARVNIGIFFFFFLFYWCVNASKSLTNWIKPLQAFTHW